MRTPTLIMTCSILLLLNACQMLDEAERPYRIEPGTPIELLQPLVIPADQVGVFIPGTPIGNRYRYEAACRLELRSLAPAARTVAADHMIITRVQRRSPDVQQPAIGTAAGTPVRQRRSASAAVHHLSVSGHATAAGYLSPRLRPPSG